MLSQQNIPEKKEKIIEYIKKNGPSLPSAVSSSINLSLLFTSALLSEMYREGRIRMSHLKIGGSPLYLLQGQEPQLDRFTKHLEKKEQEALALLKKELVLEDEKIEPSHRVAFRNIRDFAILMKINLQGNEKIFWRLHNLPREEVEKKLKEIMGIGKGRKEVKVKKPKIKISKTEREIEKTKKIGIKIERKSARKKKKEETESAIRDYLSANNLQLIKEIKYGDIFGIVISSTQLGRLRFLVITKNKKRINDADLTLALDAGQKNKTPVLLLTPGKLTKKAEKYAEENQGYLIIRNIKL